MKTDERSASLGHGIDFTQKLLKPDLLATLERCAPKDFKSSIDNLKTNTAEFLRTAQGAAFVKQLAKKQPRVSGSRAVGEQ